MIKQYIPYMILTKLKSLKINTILIVLAILSIGYFGVLMIKNNYQETVDLSVNSNNDQSKLTNINRNFLRFILVDEKTFSDVASGNITIDSATNQLEYYKDMFLEDCEDSLIDKGAIDTIFNQKIELLSKFNQVSNTHIRVGNLYVADTSMKALRFIGKSKVSYKIDPSDVKHKIHEFDHNKNNESNKIILDNFHLNFLISQEVYKYSDKIKAKMCDNRTHLINSIDKTLNRFIFLIILSIGLIVLVVKILVKRMG